MKNIILFLAICLVGVLFPSDARANCCQCRVEGQTYTVPCDMKYTGDIEFTGTVTGAGDPIPTNLLYQDTETAPNAITYYVDYGSGDDANDCLSSGAGACKTINGAIAKIPHVVKKQYQIVLDEDLHAGFILADRHFADSGKASGYGRITITCPGTGTATDLGASGVGTITSGTDYTLTDTSKNWTVNAARGYWVASSGRQFTVASNTNNTLTFVQRNVNGFDVGEGYNISTPQCTIWYSIPDGYLYNRVVMSNLSGMSSRAGYQVKLNNVVIASATADYPVVTIDDAEHVQLQQVLIKPVSAGGWSISAKNISTLELNVVYSSQAGHGGFYFEDIRTMYDYGGIVSNAVGSSSSDASVTFKDCGLVSDVAVAAYTTGSGNCIDFIGHQTIKLHRAILDSCAGDGMAVGTGTLFSRAGLSDSGVFTGSGNGGYGVSLAPFSSFIFGNGTSLTGTSGNITLDNGATSLVWGTAFASDGDKAVNSSDLCRAERKD